MLEFALRVRNSMQPSMGRTARRLSKTMPSAWHFCLSCISGTRVCGRWSRARLSGAVQKNLNTSIGAGFGGILAEKARGCWGLPFFQRVAAAILFRLGRKSHLAPCMALGFGRQKTCRRACFVSGLIPRPFRPRIRFPPAESTNKNAPRGGVFICWWSRRESNPRPQALYRPLYILRSRYLILTSHTPTGRLVRSEPP